MPFSASRLFFLSIAIWAQAVAAQVPSTPTEPLRSEANRLVNLGRMTDGRGDRREALRLFQASVALRRQVAAAQADSPASQAELADGLALVAGSMALQGKGPEALEALAECEAIARKVSAAEGLPPAAAWRLATAFWAEDAGDIHLARGDFATAQASFQSAMAPRAQWVAAHPEDTDMQQLLATAQEKTGRAQLAAGDAAAALRSHQASLRSLDAVAKDDGDAPNASLRRRRWQVLARVGDAQLSGGAIDDALATFDALLAQARDDVDRHDGMAAQARQADGTVPQDMRRVLAVGFLDSHGRLATAQEKRAGALSAKGRAFEAVAAQRAGLEEVRAMMVIARDSALAEALRKLFDRAGALQTRLGETGEALASFRAAEATAGLLASKREADVEAQQDWAAALDKSADALRLSGDRPAAASRYAQALSVRRRLAALDPGHALWQAELAVAAGKSGQIGGAGDPASRKLLEESLETLEALQRDHRLPRAYEAWLPKLRDALQAASR